MSVKKNKIKTSKRWGEKNERHWKIISSYADITRFELSAFCLVPDVLRIFFFLNYVSRVVWS